MVCFEQLITNKSPKNLQNKSAWFNGCGLSLYCKTFRFYSVSALIIDEIVTSSLSQLDHICSIESISNLLL